jgi:HD-GYP domain-containing protein (c-di-GMP phosphodiesterase class II)
VNYLKENAGKTLDPEVVRVFLQLIKENPVEKSVEILESV